jgi:uncharacterized protein
LPFLIIILKTVYSLSEIWIYPVKSLGGFSVDNAKAELKGLQYDRRWLIVDQENRFLTQREIAKMALIQVTLDTAENELKSIGFSHKSDSTKKYLFENPIEKAKTNKLEKVQVWDDLVEAVVYDDPVNGWLSEVLEFACKLAYMPESTLRNVETKFNISGNEVTSFSDGFPYLIIGSEALALLNSKLEVPIKIDRFRPNLVFEGGEAHDEDSWDNLKIGSAIFQAVKPCARCPITTINQQNGIKSKEPLKTLSTYRFKNNKVYFGQNLLIKKSGEIKIGDLINFQ